MKFQKRAPVGSGDGSKTYLKIRPGESIKLILAGDEHCFRIKWHNGKSSPADDNDPEGKFRFKVNVIVKEDGKYVAKVWEQGSIVYNGLMDINEDYKLNKTVLKVTRSGTGTDTTYSLIPMPGGIDEATLSYIRDVKLHNLTGKQTSFESIPDPAWDAVIDDESPMEIPF